MAKIILGRENQKKKSFEYWLAGAMKIKKIRQADMGKALGISQVGFGKKMKKSNFSYEEMLIIFDVLDATDEEIVSFMRM